MKYVSVLLGLAIGNYGYQIMTFQKLDVALDRTVFQAIALLCIWILTPTSKR